MALFSRGSAGSRRFLGWGVCALAVVLSAGAAFGANQTFNTTYKSSITTDGGGPLDLVMRLNYDDARANAPIMVLMHGYSSGSNLIASYDANAQRLRDAGFFVITVAMRGREGSDGVRDSGALEIYDIYDAVQAAKTTYAARVNPNNVSITGYSGGGGNTMSALTKFPDTFRVGASYFGMSDYGYNATSGWYFDGSSSAHRTQMNTDIGNPTTGGPAVLDKYMARASNLASMNNPYSEIHLFANENEPTCPPINDITYRNNAIAQASYAGQFNNITVHTGTVTPTYQDFDGDSVNDANEQQWWPHGAPTVTQQYSSEAWYLSRLVSGAIAQPVLNAADTLFVAGYVKTKPFECWLGDGTNAAGDLTYSLSSDQKTFELQIATSNKSATGWISIDTADMAGDPVRVFRDGILVDTFTGGGLYRYNGLADGQTLTLVPEPATLALFGVGAALTALRARRRRAGR